MKNNRSDGQESVRSQQMKSNRSDGQESVSSEQMKNNRSDGQESVSSEQMKNNRSDGQESRSSQQTKSNRANGQESGRSYQRKSNRSVGTDYEEKAAQYLETLGYRIIGRNFRCRMGEIDLIAKEDGYLVFIEVKYRAGSRMGEPQEAVNVCKQRKICRSASYYCMKHRVPPQQPCRFDVAACRQGEWKIIRNAFEYIP